MKDDLYTFGTSQTAAARLADIARFFNPPAAELVGRFVTRPIEMAVDLGCGPGFTTEMLAEASGAKTTFGLDKSQGFLDTAAERFGHCRFLAHDITKMPLPVTADLMYARFVLCHLAKPLDVLAAWTRQLRPGGVFIVEELDGIDTELDVFRTYLSTSEGLVASTGGSLYVGRALATAQFDADVLLDEQTVLPVPNRRAAGWFLPNTRTIWQDSAYVREHLEPALITKVRDELGRLTAGTDEPSGITWRMRRLVLRRPEKE